ncbi:MAG: methyltransferase domain-containing protein, partial [Polyangiaceae bacterium]
MWDPKQYELFRNERSRPFFDLLEGVTVEKPALAVDLGCGTGELTRIFHEKLGAHETLGIDSSAEMLAKAPADVAGLNFEQGDISDFSPKKKPNLIFSNAALQWVDAHESLFTKLAAALAPGGQLAVQMPANHDHVSHAVANETARLSQFAKALDGYVREVPVLTPEKYAALLEKLGLENQRVRIEVYGHRLESRASLIEWVKGTYLTDYSKRMSAAAYQEFIAEYTRLLFER